MEFASKLLENAVNEVRKKRVLRKALQGKILNISFFLLAAAFNRNRSLQRRVYYIHWFPLADSSGADSLTVKAVTLPSMMFLSHIPWKIWKML